MSIPTPLSPLSGAAAQASALPSSSAYAAPAILAIHATFDALEAEGSLQAVRDFFIAYKLDKVLDAAYERIIALPPGLPGMTALSQRSAAAVA